MKIFETEFLSPIYFVLILLVPIFLFLYYQKQKNETQFIFLDDLKKVFKHNNIYYYSKLILIIAIIVSYISLLANPNIGDKTEKITKNGIDIVMVLDISESMRAMDLSPTRLDAAKSVIKDFIAEQETNRLGLVVFAGVAFESIPLTFDYNIYDEIIGNIETKNIDQRYDALAGTVIGDAIIMGQTLFDKDEGCPASYKGDCEKFLEENKKREKVIILVSDGAATHGLNPMSAAMYAKEKGIKIYTIGIGSLEGGEIKYNNSLIRYYIEPLKEDELKEIAQITDGKYYRATDNAKLTEIFDDLEKLEKHDIEIDTKKMYISDYREFAYIILSLLFLYIILILGKPEV